MNTNHHMISNFGTQAMPLRIFAIIFLFGLISCEGDPVERAESIIGAKGERVEGTSWTNLDPSSTGITFKNTIEESYQHFFMDFNYVYNGGGVAIGDLDNDGFSDIYFSGNEVQDRIYKNLGSWKFEDVTEQANLMLDVHWNNGVTMADVNGDGLLDIYVCKGGFVENNNENLLYINKGNFRFENEAKAYGLADPGFSMHANFFDADNDGDLDVFVINRPNKWALSGNDWDKFLAAPPTGTSDVLYLNQKGKFVNANESSGIGSNFGYALSCSIIDINNDNLMDIYVANDFLGNDYFYVNQGNGKFKESVRDHTNHNSFFAMGSDVQDINNDGFEDLFVTEMLPSDYKRAKITMFQMIGDDRFDALFNNGKWHHQYMHNTMNLNTGNNFMVDVSSYSGLKDTDWSWAGLISDFDNDGYRDVFVANGFKRDVYDRDNAPIVMDSVLGMGKKTNWVADSLPSLTGILDHYLPTVKMANRMFRNVGGLKFEDIGKQWGMEELSLSNGAAVGDLDNDGDLDLVVNNIDDNAFVYRNDFGKANYLRVQLEGPKGNTNGIGALIEIEAGGKKWMERFKTVRGYLSSVEPIAHFGLGKISTIDRLQITWHDASTTVLNDVDVNQTIKVKYSDSKRGQWNRGKGENAFFKETTDSKIKNWAHKENYFKDFRRQILLPHRQSMHGPAMAIGDVNGDGLDDVFFGGAYKEPAALFIQNTKGQFVEKTGDALKSSSNYEDVGAEFLDIDGDGDKDLYVVSGGMEHAIQSQGYQDRIYLNDGDGQFEMGLALPEMNISGSVAKSTDIDKDGVEEVFVGGRHFPFFYPEPVSSMVFKNFNGTVKTLNGGTFIGLDTLGMVTDAEWVDMNGDQLPELVIVGEWMPITVFGYRDGKFVNMTSELNLDKTTGWWFSVEAADLDNDGDQDLVLGNLGMNYKFKASEDKPFEIYADDFDENGSYDIFLAKQLDDKRLVPIRGRDCTSEQVPEIAEKFPTFRDFAEEDLFGLLGNDVSNARHLKAYDFASVIMENRNGGFVRHQLPKEAQFSTVRGIVIDDFNADGTKDILIAGNMFPTEAETTRADASVGLLLKGMGGFKYESVPSAVSGISLPFDVRHMSSIKLAGSEENGILVAVNNGRPVLYERNEKGKKF